MHEFHTLLREWESFYLLLGTAGATLAGLMFVAITLGERSTSRERLPILRAHLDPALLALVLVLILSAFLMMPTLTRLWFGVLLVAAGVAGVVYISVVLRSLFARGVRGWDVSDWLGYAIAPQLSSALLIVSGGLAFSSQSRAALTTVGLSLVLLLSMGIRNAWDLVTFLIRLNAPETTPGGGDTTESGTGDAAERRPDAR